MGTRSLTRVIENSKVYMVMYRQYDGFPNTHGKELSDFIGAKPIVNGMSGGRKGLFNGASCLAASIVSFFKIEAGGFYLYPSDTTDAGQDYTYDIVVKEPENFNERGVLTFKVESYGKVLFEGGREEFAEFCGKEASGEE